MSMRKFIMGIMGLFAAFLMLGFFPSTAFTRSTTYDMYVCTSCGLKKVEDIRKFGGLRYHRRVVMETSAISRATRVNNCQHSWLRYRYGHNSKRPLFGGGTFIDAGAPSYDMLRYLLIDDEFAEELSRMRNPTQTWSALVCALNSDKAFEDAFSSWWMESDPVPFAVWAVTNGLPH